MLNVNQIRALLKKADAARLIDHNREDSWIRGYCDALIAVLNLDGDDEETINVAISGWKFEKRTAEQANLVTYRGYSIKQQLGDSGNRQVGITGKWSVNPSRDEEHSLDGQVVVESLDKAIETIDQNEGSR